jgi:pimeloyl-ACP methyl ester carboxylesterase
MSLPRRALLVRELWHQLLDAAGALRVPTLLVRGALSDIVSVDAVAEFRAAVPHASYVDVSEAGHMVASDRNDVFTDAVVEFLTTNLGREE